MVIQQNDQYIFVSHEKFVFHLHTHTHTHTQKERVHVPSKPRRKRSRSASERDSRSSNNPKIFADKQKLRTAWKSG